MRKRQGSGKKGSTSVAVLDDGAAKIRAADPAALAAIIEAVASRVLKLSKLQPEEIAELMESEQGSQLMDIEPLAAGAGGGASIPLQAWSDVKVASPAPLSDAQYERFLKGQDPFADNNSDSKPVELYGAHLA